MTNTDRPSSSTDSDHSRPQLQLQRQMAFTTEGGLEAVEDAAETSLVDFGASVDHRDRTSRIDRPEASTFGVDDRREIRTKGQPKHKQQSLFADTDPDPVTPGGSQANTQFLFNEQSDTETGK